VDTTSAGGGGNKRQKIAAVHGTSQSREGADAGAAHSAVTVAGGPVSRGGCQGRTVS